ncbi:FeoB-associated Cys-rich membrane protein [Halosquirtibacter laminarini]|uniref:FeoB-associated Cys-rich membrane protein n=1 Tax=Halosquirtibacter laminarini TaxID=3374600 RepID=A0AC61NR67_9BACT|nr:FeoB-associated Cys-rich membrane protein [Prolixibacteraceae bacterium]
MIQTVVTAIIIAIALYFFFIKTRKNFLKFKKKNDERIKSACDSCDGCALKENNLCSEEIPPKPKEDNN